MLLLSLSRLAIIAEKRSEEIPMLTKRHGSLTRRARGKKERRRRRNEKKGERPSPGRAQKSGPNKAPGKARQVVLETRAFLPAFLCFSLFSSLSLSMPVDAGGRRGHRLENTRLDSRASKKNDATSHLHLGEINCFHIKLLFSS